MLIKVEEFAGIITENGQCLCRDCISGDWNDLTQDQVLLESEDEDSLRFCDKCDHMF